MGNTNAADNFKILDSVPHGIFILDSRFNVVFWNQILEVWTNISPDEILNTCIFDSYPHLKNDIYLKQISETFESGDSFVFPSKLFPQFLPINNDDGSAKLQKTTVRLHTNRDSSQKYAIISIVDMTQLSRQFDELDRLRMAAMDEIEKRRNMITELKINEERFTLAQKAANIGSWDWDVVTGDLIWSDTIEPMFGFARGEFPGTYDSFVKCLHPDDVQLVQDSVKKAIERDYPYRVEHRIIWPDGSVRWISESGAVMRNESGEAIRMLGIVMDITSRKESEEEIRKLRAGIEQTTDSVIITDTSAEIQYANPAFEKMTGYAKEELIGKNTRILNSGIHSDSFYETLWKTISSGRIWHDEIINKKKDGSLYTEEMTITPVIDRNHKIVNYVAIKRDISDKKELEKKLDQLRKEYEAFMRHELKNYLTPVKGYSELLLAIGSDNLSEQQKTILNKINAGSNKIVKIVDEIKKLHDFEDGLFELDLIKSDIHTIIRQVISDFDLTLSKTGVTIDFRYDDFDSTIYMDLNLLPGVFFNLIKNAIEHVQYSDNEDEKTVTIDLNHDLSNIIIRINNKGAPVSPERLKLFFEKFNTDRSVKISGSGLGTTYAYLVTKAHGGGITVESDEIEGTTVTLLFHSAICTGEN